MYSPYNPEKNFRRFEPALRQLCSTFPNPFVFRPHGLKPSSARALMRAAASAYIKPECLWESDIDKKNLAMILNRFRFSTDGHRVYVAQADKNIRADFSYDTNENLIVDKPTKHELLAFALLITNKRFNAQITFYNVPPDLAAFIVQELESNPLVQFFQDGEDWVMI